MKPLYGWLAALGISWAAAVGSAQAVTHFTLSNLDGDPLQVHVTLQEVANGLLTGVQITLNVDAAYQADLRGAYFHLSDETLLSGLQLAGTHLTAQQIDANNVKNVGNGNNINGQVANTFGGFDVGVSIGSPGIGQGDDFPSFTFVVSHATQSITESLFHELPFAIRATSVGPAGGSRDGSSKLAGYVPTPDDNTPTGDPLPDPVATPEPAAAAMGVVALTGLAIASRRRR